MSDSNKLTQPEIIGRRVIIALQETLQAIKSGVLSIESGEFSLRKLSEATSPFIDPESIKMLTHVTRNLRGKLKDKEVLSPKEASLSDQADKAGINQW